MLNHIKNSFIFDSKHIKNINLLSIVCLKCQHLKYTRVHNIYHINTNRINNTQFLRFDRLNASKTWRYCSSDANSNEGQKQTIAEKFMSYLPHSLQPYVKLMRLDKPTGVWLLLLPCYWSIAMATPASHLPSLETLFLFTSGALLMRGAGCVVNDIWDRDIDSKVLRTKSRPIASKQISVMDAVIFLGGQLGCSLLILLQFDLNSIVLGASSLLLVALYPSLKRYTNWPQLGLGLTFNWGALLGWSVVTNGHLNLLAVLPLYFGGVCWTLVYDTIYAHQDKTDDANIGVKSTALIFGENTVKWLSGFSALMCTNFIIAGTVTEQCWPYYTAISLIAIKLAQQMYTLKIDDSSDCWRKFKEHTTIGFILFIGIVLSTYIKKDKVKKNDNDVNIFTNISIR